MTKIINEFACLHGTFNLKMLEVTYGLIFGLLSRPRIICFCLYLIDELFYWEINKKSFTLYTVQVRSFRHLQKRG